MSEMPPGRRPARDAPVRRRRARAEPSPQPPATRRKSWRRASADLLEELLRLSSKHPRRLDLERLVSVLEEMESIDDAALLAEMPGEQRTRVLEAMEPDEADLFRRLLSYSEGTAVRS